MVTKAELNKHEAFGPWEIHYDDSELQGVRVSVIIPAHNEEKYIERTLASLRDHRYRDIDILVVANGCTDKTVEIAERSGVTVINLVNPNMNSARNIGAENAPGELLIFLDADTYISDNLIIEAVKYYKKHPYAVSTCAVYSDVNSFPAQALMKVKNTLHRLGVRTGGSGIIICPKNVFMRAGGFDLNKNIFEIRNFLKRACNGNRYHYLKGTWVTTSTRRYIQKGYLHCFWFWIKNWVLTLFKRPHRTDYEVLR